MKTIILSTECVNDWHPDCRITSCGCDCHLAGVPAIPTGPAPLPKSSVSRERVFDAVVAYHRQNGYAPSVRELADLVGLGAGTVNYHLHWLDAAGRISMSRRRARTVVPVTEPV